MVMLCIYNNMKKALKFIQFIFFVICLAFLLYAFFQEKEVIKEILDSSIKIYLLIAIILWPLTIFLSGIFAWIVLGGNHSGVKYSQILAIYMNRVPAKYLPGGVWHTVARAYDFNFIGLSRSKIAVLVF